MHTSRLFLAVMMAAAGLMAAYAQTPLTPAEQDRMLEILRQKVAEERAKMPTASESSGTVAAPPQAPLARTETVQETPAPSKAAETHETPFQRHMLEVLRSAVAKERAAETARAEALALTTRAPSDTKPAPPTAPAKVSAISPAPAPAPAAPAETVAPAPASETPPGPKTKQERLEALLLLYRADQITPREYHEQRAKIIAEP